MSQRVPYQGFIGSAFSAQSKRLDTQDLWNWYLEHAASPAAKAGQALLPCPGFEPFVTLADTPVRGLFAQNLRTFAIGGDALYELFVNGDVVERTMTTLFSFATSTTLTITQSPLAPAIDPPLIPVITHGGATGATTYGYRITAFTDYGQTTGSPEGTSAFGQATLSSTNRNIVSWPAVQGTKEYGIYRTTGGSPAPPRLLARVPSTQLVYHDIGQEGTSTALPTTNGSGQPVGATTYSYRVTGTLGLLEAAPTNVSASTTTGPTTLSSTNYNIIKWTALPNADGYKIYRISGGFFAPRLIGTVLGGDTLEFNDTGEEGELVTAPAEGTDYTGTIPIYNDGAPVTWASSGDAGEQLLFTSGGYAYCFDLETNVLAPVVEGAHSCGFIDSYFVVLDASTSTLKVSESFDGMHWDPTQVYQRSRAGDKWVALAVVSNYIWLVGTQSSEVWNGTGNADTRFVPYAPVFIETGIIAASTMIRGVGDTLIWVAQDKDGSGFVVRTNGYQPEKISTTAVDYSLQRLTSIGDGYSISYQQDGHTFYVITFPADAVTWVYDVTTNEWHRRGYWDSDARAFTAYRPFCHAFAFGGIGYGFNLVGDRYSGRISKLNVAYGFDFDGALIRRVRQCPHVADRDMEMTFDRFQMDMEVGLGLSPEQQGSTPTMMLAYSNDGGNTWGKELWRNAGRIGDFRIQVAWSRLGTAKNRVFRLVVSDPIPWRLVGAWLELEGS